MADDFEYLPGCKFNPAGIDDCEDIEQYEPGGFHPVSLDDQYDGNRYKVVNKLGAGGFSTVWLARDLQAGRWVGLKLIIAAKSEDYDARSSAILEDPVLASSEFVVNTERRFWVDGPNGRHLGIVLPLVGPNLATLSNGIYTRIKPAFAANLSLQAAQAMAVVHSRGKCHGDFTANNIALALSTDIQSYEIDDIPRVFGHPQTGNIVPCSDEQESPGPHAPQYVVEPIDFCAANVRILTQQLRILDFDQCFSCESPLKDLGTPARYMAPEIIAGEPPSKASDVWSLGCTIFRLRSGFDLFFDYDTHHPAEALQQIQRFLGNLPDSLAQARFDNYGYATRDESGRPLTNFLDKLSLDERIAQIWDDPPSMSMSSNGEVDIAEYPPPSPPSTSFYPEDAKKVMPYPQLYESMLWKPTAVRVDGLFYLAYEDNTSPHWGAFPRIGTEEAKLLGDLLLRIFVYDPSRRITVQEVLEHPWILKSGRISGADA